MLRNFPLIIVVTIVMVCSSSLIAAGNPDQECLGVNYQESLCLRYGGGDSAPGKDASPRKRRGSGERVCEHAGTPVPCTTDLGTWVQHRQMWCKPASSQPPKTDPIWAGHTTGVIHTCTRPSGTNVPDPSMAFLAWLPDTASTPPPDPEQIAWELIAATGFDPITIGTTPTALEHNPRALGAVGMPLWLWPKNPSPHTTGPVHASTSKQGYTVTISGTVTSIDWDLGDGSEAITCTSWKPAHPTMTTINTPVTCGRQEGYSRQGIYSITATSNWSIAWQGIGESGTITIPVTSTATVKIGELQALNTTGKQR